MFVHHWREIVLNQPLFWSHVDFTTLTSAGAAEILARVETAPLHLEARVPIGQWDGARFSEFQKELQARVSHVCHLALGAEHFHLRKTLEELISPAPTLEYLSLFSDGHWDSPISLSHLLLHKCDISWKSPLLKGLEYLEIDIPSRDARPSLSDWLDALDEMRQLKTLGLHSTSPIAPPGALLPSGVERTVTLPSLAHLNISASVKDCGLAIAHLLLLALTRLSLSASSCTRDGSDVQGVLPYVARHAHGPQDTQSLQSVLVCNNKTYTNVHVWTKPNIDVCVAQPDRLSSSHALCTCNALSREQGLISWDPRRHLRSCDDSPPHGQPRDIYLTSPHNSVKRRDGPCSSGCVWQPLRHVDSRRCCSKALGNANAHRLMNLVLDDTGLSARRTLRLCDALMKRAEQAVPLETLDLRTCLMTSRAIELLRKIVVDVLGPETSHEKRVQTSSVTTWTVLGYKKTFDEDYDYGYDYDRAVRGDKVWGDSDSGGDSDRGGLAKSFSGEINKAGYEETNDDGSYTLTGNLGMRQFISHSISYTLYDATSVWLVCKPRCKLICGRFFSLEVQTMTVGMLQLVAGTRELTEVDALVQPQTTFSRDASPLPPPPAFLEEPSEGQVGPRQGAKSRLLESAWG
ncbi:hypothetical protein EDB87DRAFT_1577273 [Lactarius vividus]|nr:hypothetical protein EDB87DRAFT_1577273 [Lactarius vividus]